MNCALFNKIMQAVRCPSDELSLTNCVFTSEKEQQFEQWVALCNLVKLWNCDFGCERYLSTSPVANWALSLHPPFFCLNIQTHKRPQFKPQLCVYLENTPLSHPGDPRLQSPTGRCRCVREDPPSYIILNADCCLMIAQFSYYFSFFLLFFLYDC